METIGISPRFFTHDLNNYSHWQLAFWRELVQNSVDENSSRIEISVTQDEGKCKARFADNGPGMSEDTMRNVYFQLGETGKAMTNTIGGHGRARILTCFAHESYRIRTRNLLCEGHGGSFQINNTLPHQNGCTVEVDITADSAERMEASLRTYLSFCQLDCDVTINGERFTQWLHRRRASRLLSFGSVHTIKSTTYCVITRVRGVAMFKNYSGCETGVILEMDPQKSRDLLTVSRDNLKYEAREELENFINSITVDNSSIKRDCIANKTEIFGKFRTLKDRNRQQTNRVLPPPTGAATVSGCETTRYTWGDSAIWATAAYGATETTQPTMPHLPEPPIEYSVHYEDAPKAIRASASRFHPDKLGGNRLKLLLAWDEALRFIIESCEKLTGEEYLYLPGFGFGTTFAALHKTEQDGETQGHLLYINPLDENGKIKVSCHDYEALYSLALHECTHILVRPHNEDWASKVTELCKDTCGRLSELKTRIRETIKTNLETSIPNTITPINKVLPR